MFFCYCNFAPNWSALTCRLMLINNHLNQNLNFCNPQANGSPTQSGCLNSKAQLIDETPPRSNASAWGWSATANSDRRGPLPHQTNQAHDGHSLPLRLPPCSWHRSIPSFLAKGLSQVAHLQDQTRSHRQRVHHGRMPIRGPSKNSSSAPSLIPKRNFSHEKPPQWIKNSPKKEPPREFDIFSATVLISWGDQLYLYLKNTHAIKLTPLNRIN